MTASPRGSLPEVVWVTEAADRNSIVTPSIGSLSKVREGMFGNQCQSGRRDLMC